MVMIMKINGTEYDISELKDGDIINKRWLVITGCTSPSISFIYLTDNNLETYRDERFIDELKPNENTVWVCYEYDDVFVCEYYHYGEDGEDFNGYKRFESIEDAMNWCEEHTSKEIHKILSN